MKKRIEVDIIPKWTPHEYFSDLIPSLKEKGFICGGSHCTFFPLMGSATCFARLEGESLPCTDCPSYKEGRRRIVEITPSEAALIRTHPVFFDWDDNFYPSDHPCRIELQCGRRYIGTAGIYCERLHLLHATDWTHRENFLPLARKIVSTLPKRRVSLPNLKSLLPTARITIGCDPEFEQLTSNNEVVHQDLPEVIRTLDGEVGVDGAGYQIELRPKEDSNHRRVIARIRRLIEKANRNLGVKGDIYPLGCHLHFGLPGIWKADTIKEKIVEILDDFLGRKLLSLSGNARGEYKCLSAYRDQPWGIEYRTLPSAVLWNPEIGRIVFKIAKNVVQEFVNKKCLEYSDPPKKEDYLRICKLTSKEYHKFIHFPEEYRRLYRGEAINANWRIKSKIEVIIYLRDEWDWQIQRQVRDILKNKLEKIKEPLTITIYGLREGRGEVVAGYDSKFAERIDHPITVPDNQFIFGWPYIWRMDRRKINKITKAANELAEIIKRTIKERRS
ncbi:MAG: hypothetical protein DRO05_03645 [Thermoproteota archaeon]|nr:MAG: hypothetical protein DRO05_03645 [Candidatus Korarchaeota archaeon]